MSPARALTVGLPPPARGAPVRCRQAGVDGRSTPACAGSTATGVTRSGWRRVYPRLRGEHHMQRHPCRVQSGLPPPARGARDPKLEPHVLLGSTPACAGSTHHHEYERHIREVYPRLRGEHRGWASGWRIPAGLPPPARGARREADPEAAQERSTPACAGSTPMAPSSPKSGTVYPRLRGEHGSPAGSAPPPGGLPPPARGAQEGRGMKLQRLRSTPACAGSTSTPAPSLRSPAVYPRLRGEHAMDLVEAAEPLGLPPPARGARERPGACFAT